MTLHDYITSRLRAVFLWGEHDCVLFASGWVQAATGKDPLKGLPNWKTEKGARRAIKGVGGIEKAIDERFTRIDPRIAKDGDLAFYNDSVCIFSGPHIVGPGMNGLQFIDRMKAKCAWSI